MTQILVARAPPSPQFYCAYRSIQAAPISPGARLEILRGSAFTSRRRPPTSLASTSLFPLASLPLGCYFFVLRLSSASPRLGHRIRSLDKCHDDSFFFSVCVWHAGTRDELSTFRRSFTSALPPLLASGEMSLETKVRHTWRSSGNVP